MVGNFRIKNYNKTAISSYNIVAQDYSKEAANKEVTQWVILL